MVIYARKGDYISYIIPQQTSGRMKPSEFFNAFKSDLLVTFNGLEDTAKYPNNIIFSVTNKQSFLEYCAENKLNCSGNDWERADYEVCKMYYNFDTLVAPKLNVWNAIRKKYKLSASVLKYNEIALIKEVLGLK